MRISEFMVKLRQQQGKFGDIEIQTEHDDIYNEPRLSIKTEDVVYDFSGDEMEEKHIPHDPILIIK